MAYNRYALQQENPAQEPTMGFWRRLSERSWSPVKVMSDEEYAELLQQKMMKVDVEIAILDDRIAALRKEQQPEDLTPLPQDKSG